MVYSNLASKMIAENAFYESATTPLQFIVESEQEDLKLFNALIEVDIAESLNESGVIALTEADKEAAKKISVKKIMDNILTAIKKAFAMVKKFFTETIPGFFKKLVDRDEKLRKKYGSVLTWDAVKNCKLEGRTVNYKEFDRLYNSVNSMLGSFVEDDDSGNSFTIRDHELFLDQVDRSNNPSEVVERAKKFYTAIKERHIGEDGPDKSTFINDKEGTIVDKLGSDGFKEMKRIVESKYGETLKASQKVFADFNKELKKEEAAAKKASNAGSDDANEVVRLNCKYQIISMAHTTFSLLMTFYKSGISKYISITRSNYVALGNYAMGGHAESKEAQNESAYVLSELSNYFVEECFE